MPRPLRSPDAQGAGVPPTGKPTSSLNSRRPSKETVTIPAAPIDQLNSPSSINRRPAPVHPKRVRESARASTAWVTASRVCATRSVRSSTLGRPPEMNNSLGLQGHPHRAQHPHLQNDQGNQHLDQTEAPSVRHSRLIRP